MLGPGARLVTSAAERIVQTPAASSPTLTVLATIAGTVATVATTVVSLRGFIKDELTANSKEQTANINMLKSELAANSKEQTANISMLKSELAANSKEQTATISMLNSELVANTASGRELKSEVNTKLDAVSTSVQAQRVQSADLRGQVGVLRDVVTTTPSPTQK